MTEYGRFPVEDARRIAAQARRTEAISKNPTVFPPTNASVLTAQLEGFLVSQMAASASRGQVPTTAKMVVWRGGGTGGSWCKGQTVTVTNRDDGFSASAGSYLVVAEVNGELRPIRAGGAGSGTQTAIFTIDSYDYVSGIAICNIEYRPNGVAIVSGESQYATIEVIDPAGCYFNEDEADLIGRWGTASYMQPIRDIDQYQSAVWVVIGLCCPEA